MNIGIFLTCLLGLVVSLPSFAADIYKWTDDNGVTHYSDMPREGATEVEVEPAQTFSNPEVSSGSNNTEEADDGSNSEKSYESIAISSPSMEETIWNTGGNVTVSVSLQPVLQSGHSLRLYLDGQSMGDFPPRSSSVTLTEITRGMHVVQSEVVNSKGRVIVKSEPVTFFYKQATVNNPARPRPPIATPLPTRRVGR